MSPQYARGRRSKGGTYDVGCDGTVQVAPADGHAEDGTALVGSFHIARYPCARSESIDDRSTRLDGHYLHRIRYIDGYVIRGNMVMIIFE